MITAETIEEEVKSLPPLKQTVVEVMLELNHNDVDFDVLEKKISKDPALAVRMLAVANSPFYGFAGKIDSIKEACLVLGIHTTRNIVLAAGVLDNFKPGCSTNIDIEGLWQHSLATAAIAKIIAQKIGADAEQAFSAGLLHDIGKMVLDVHYAEDYKHVVEYSHDNDCSLSDAEQAVLGFNHFDIGSRIITHWKLPEEIALAIEENSQFDTENNSCLGDLIHLANIMARGLGLGDSGDDSLPTLNEQTLKNIGITFATLTNFFTEFEQASKAAGAFMKV